MSQTKSSRIQVLPAQAKSQMVSWLRTSDVRQLSKVSKSLAQAAKKQLQVRRQQQYRQINSTLGEQLSKLNIPHATMPPEITHLPMLPIAMFTSVTDARKKLLPHWNFRKDRLVYSKRYNNLYWLITGKPFEVHHRYLNQLSKKIRK